MIDVTEILVHWYAGHSKNEMAASLGVDRKTIRKYTVPAVRAGLVAGRPPVSEARWAELSRQWFAELADARLRQVTWSAIEAHHEFIAAQLEARGDCDHDSPPAVFILAGRVWRLSEILWWLPSRRSIWVVAVSSALRSGPRE